MTPAASFNVLPFPGNVLARRLDAFTAPVRVLVMPFNRHHLYKGTGTFELFCPLARLESWHRDAGPRRTMTSALAGVGAGAQALVWCLVGVSAGLASGLVYWRDGRLAARMFLADHYVPTMAAIMMLSVGAYVAVAVGGVLLLRGLLR